MDGAKLIERIRLKNILSFGSEGQEIALEPLNVLIGPNGAGKSNLIESLGILRAAPGDLIAPFRTGGGTREWLWKGSPENPVAEIEVVVRNRLDTRPLLYRLHFTAVAQRFELVDEAIENPYTDNVLGQTYFYYRYLQGNPLLRAYTGKTLPANNGAGHIDFPDTRELRKGDFTPNQSILSQRRDPDQFPQLTYLNEQFGRLQFYREANLGRLNPLRRPQPTDLPNDFLLEDGGNLGLVLSGLERRGLKRRIVELLQRFYEPVSDFTLGIEGSTVQVFLHEEGLTEPVPAIRLSDGTLRFLCLLAILLHPSPPPLVCLEEPELGLHPDVIPLVAELLVEASQRTQLIVTTHSDALVAALSDTPEAVIVCERDQQGTKLRRLEPHRLKEWLERYTLGDLWHMGEIGGTRW